MRIASFYKIKILRKVGSDQKQEMILNILRLFLVNYKIDQHLNLITTLKINALLEVQVRQLKGAFL